MELLLHGFGPYKWKEIGNVLIIGSVYNEPFVVESLNSVNSFESFAETIKEISGNFSIIVKKKNIIWTAVDNARSFPLFFSEDTSVLSDRADSVVSYYRQVGKLITINDIALAEMVSSRNTKYEETVYQQIKQCDLGTAYCFGQGKKEVYYLHLIRECGEQNSIALVDKFREVIDEVFDRCIDTIGDRQVIVPLSGGYDSRLILSVLYMKKITNVVCYTYGREDDYDVKTSKLVAEVLGYQWYFIPYKGDDWKEFWDEKNEKRKEYFEYSHNHSSLPHIQDYIALKNLKDKGVFKEGAVVIPGFCADLPAGSFVKVNLKNEYSIDDLVEEIYSECFINVKLKDKYENYAKERIRKNLSFIHESKLISRSEFVHLFNCWFTGDRPAKWVVNSVRVYEFFDMEWRLPFWDKSFLNFFYGLDVERLQQCKFYIDYIFNEYFIPLGIDVRKPTSSHLSDTNQNGNLKHLIKTIVKRKLIDFSYWTGIYVYNRNGTNNYNVACRCLYQKLKKMGYVQGKYGGVHQIEMIWWCIEKYGINTIKELIEEEN